MARCSSKPTSVADSVEAVGQAVAQVVAVVTAAAIVVVEVCAVDSAGAVGVKTVPVKEIWAAAQVVAMVADRPYAKVTCRPSRFACA